MANMKKFTSPQGPELLKGPGAEQRGGRGEGVTFLHPLVHATSATSSDNGAIILILQTTEPLQRETLSPYCHAVHKRQDQNEIPSLPPR